MNYNLKVQKTFRHQRTIEKIVTYAQRKKHFRKDINTENCGWDDTQTQQPDNKKDKEYEI